MESMKFMSDDYITENYEEYERYKNDLKLEINNVVLNKWGFLDNDWGKINKKYKHRTEIKEIKNMTEIKNELKSKLGYIGVFFFLNELYTNSEYPGPYLEIDKGLYLLYHLINGSTHKEINKDLPSSSFYTFYKKFWITNYEKINKKVNYCLLNMFSNIKIRILSALIKNPKYFKHITLLLDGHDSTIEYTKPDISLQKRWSYKLKTSGLRTQVLVDINEMVILVSKSELCGESSDGSMFLNMKLYKYINKEDCIAFDGGYTLFVNQFIELCINKGIDLSDKNFFYPIRKESGVELNEQEKHFNKVFGKFRNIVENQFCELNNTYKRFSNNNSTIKTSDYKYINLQLKVAFLLKNIKRFSEKFNIITQPHHKLWENKNFEFPSDLKLVDIVYINEMQQLEKIKEMEKLQKDIMNININDNMILDENIIDDLDIENNNNTSDDDFPDIKVKDINKIDEVYEIEKIIKHKIEDRNYKFLVKWKGYDDIDNSWISISAFNEKDMLREYINSKNILIHGINL